MKTQPTSLFSHRSTLFLPPSDHTFHVYSHLLTEIHRPACVIVQAKDFCTIYAIGFGWFHGQHEYPDGSECPEERIEIYYVVSDWHCAQILCVHLDFRPRCHLDLVAMKQVPAELSPMEHLDLVSRFGQAFRTQRFCPRLLPKEL